MFSQTNDFEEFLKYEKTYPSHIVYLYSQWWIKFFNSIEGDVKQVSKWWKQSSVNNPSLPFSPYKTRREDSSLLEMHSANKIILKDKRLFWGGSGAIAVAETTKKVN